MDKLLTTLLLLLSLPLVYGFDFLNFPEPFILDGKFETVGVYPDNDNDYDALLGLFTSLSESHNIYPIPDIRLDGQEIDFSKNVISIGGPCANKVTAKIMNISHEWPACKEGFEDSRGIIKIYNKWGKTQLIIAGYNAEDTANFVSRFENFNEDALIRDSYFTERNDKILASKNSLTEPDFDSTKMCWDDPSAPDKVHPCSCGDGICASYEWKGSCIPDCGSCPENTFFRFGQCVAYVPNSCLNSICDEDEVKNCPWDCPILKEESIEDVSENSDDLQEEIDGESEDSTEDELPVEEPSSNEEQENTDTNIVLVIDISSGMSDYSDEEKELVADVVNALNINSDVGIVAFNNNAFEVSSIQVLNEHKTDSLKKISKLAFSNGKIFEKGIMGAVSMLGKEEGDKNIILFTDGVVTDEEAAYNIVRTSADKEINLYVVGVGDDSNDLFLSNVARIGNGIYFQTQPVDKIEVLFG